MFRVMGRRGGLSVSQNKPRFIYPFSLLHTHIIYGRTNVMGRSDSTLALQFLSPVIDGLSLIWGLKCDTSCPFSVIRG
jgi:hypothetical protein